MAHCTAAPRFRASWETERTVFSLGDAAAASVSSPSVADASGGDPGGEAEQAALAGDGTAASSGHGAGDGNAASSGHGTGGDAGHGPEGDPEDGARHDPAATAERPAPHRGRPPSQGTERAILRATTELLAERGLSDTTIEEIAARARVSKASVYRRWPSKGTLAFAAFMVDFYARQPAVDTGSLRGDLLATLRGWLRAVRQPATGRTLRGLIAEVQRDPELAAPWRDRFIGPLRERHLEVLERAIARGELTADANTGLMLDLLYGPAYHRLLHGHLPLNDAFAEDLVAAIMGAVESGAV